MRDTAGTLPVPGSATADKVSATLTRRVADVAHKLIQGQATRADWEQAVVEWRKAGGDTIRGEYEQSWSQSPGR